MQFNWWIILAATFIPMVIGFIWYHPKTMGTAWMRASGMTEEKIRSSNMAKIFGLTILLSFMIAFFMPIIVIHQSAFLGLMNSALISTDPAVQEAAKLQVADFDANFGGLHRSFGHGVLHGLMMSILLVLPIIAINALFERKSARYIFLHWGYWALSISLMGGVICAWA